MWFRRFAPKGGFPVPGLGGPGGPWYPLLPQCWGGLGAGLSAIDVPTGP